MTVEEAIEILREKYEPDPLLSRVNMAIEVALEALEKQIAKEAEKTAFSIDRYVEKDILTGKTMCPVCGNTIFFHIEGSFKERVNLNNDS